MVVLKDQVALYTEAQGKSIWRMVIMGRLGSSSLEGYLRVMDRLYNATTMLSNAMAINMTSVMTLIITKTYILTNSITNDHQMTSTMTDTMTMIMIRRICNM